MPPKGARCHMAEFLIGIALGLLSALPAMAVTVYRRLRNLDALEAALRQAQDAHRHQRIALGMAAQATTQAQAAEAQLAACRAVLGVTMRQRDDYERAVEVLARKLADLKQERRRERQYLRFWITRTIKPQKVSEN